MGQIKNPLLSKTRRSFMAAQSSAFVVPPGREGGAAAPPKWDGGIFSWPARIILMGAGRGRHWSADGFYALYMPTSGTIVGYGGTASVVATAAGIPLNVHSVLWAILPTGGAASVSTAAQYAVTGYSSDFVVPENWYPVAAVPENDNFPGKVLKTCWGETMDSWRTFSFLNGWADYGGSYPARYKLVNGNMVQMKGIIRSGTLGASAFTMPVGFRPGTAGGVLAAGTWNGSNYGTGPVRIASDGSFQVHAGTNTEIYLDGISYVAEN